MRATYSVLLIGLALIILIIFGEGVEIAQSVYGLEYEMDDRELGPRFSEQAIDFSHLRKVQTDYGVHLASYTKVTGAFYPGGQAVSV
jgi:hypothetical protein